MSWQTPEEVLSLVRKVNKIELDPCTTALNPVKADRFFTKAGLEESWATVDGGLVYVNPPYGTHLKAWVKKATEESWNAEIILLVPCRPDTRWYDACCVSANAKCEWYGRMTFVGAEAPAPFPSALFYWGYQEYLFCHAFKPHGRVEVLRSYKER